MRTIITYGGYFEAFMQELTERQQEKIKYGLLLLKTLDRVPAKFVKHIEDGIFELRTEYEGNIFRTFFIFDGNSRKKTQETPRGEIEKAKRIKKEYYKKAHQ
jgi:phage-related protein